MNRKLPALYFLLMMVAPLAAAGGLTPEQQLGKKLYEDVNLSLQRNQSCATCHSLAPSPGTVATPGFVDPVNVASGTPVSAGSVAGKTGALNTPSAGYAAFSPAFHRDKEEGNYVGGQFWNGRAATLADQAREPFLNPNEMAMPSEWAVVTRLKQDAEYRRRFRELYRVDLSRIPDNARATSEDKAPAVVTEAYARMVQAIAAFESSPVFNRFTAKFDFYLAGKTTLTAQEMQGLKVFEGDKSQCSACHTSEPTVGADGRKRPPLFTDFTYDNLGLPRNVNIPGNPEPDPGLALHSQLAGKLAAEKERGKHKVMSLRNIAITAPYGHNGVFRTLEEITHFYNTRDTKPKVCRDNNDPGFGKTCWPAPEVRANLNTEELGNLELTPEEEAALVAFMKTLTDGYPDWGKDPKVPPGTPSPFAYMVPPPVHSK
ncbi:cytochrome C [Sulfuricaulis limicola]|uniref:Cytochrome C n=1 Tax=Sulfuricaulis limicola TaxID=1620215 RepID=A0A1B4XJG8_9GAMM|nr:cytochrome c peroxidase [Sulfuricaulis limicola]BAV34943.1 cytochrome C [Sulfuricaulis limicola]